MNAVELSGVTKVDEGGAILDSVSLAIPAEAFWAVMGARPCLSALLAVASGRVQPDLGTSLLFGQPAHKSRKAAALIRGDSFALEFADVRTNVEARALILGLPHPARAAAEALRAAGIDFQAMRASECSALERWLARLALALVGNPRVLCINEPTQGLVASDMGEFISTARRIASARGLTLVCGTGAPDSLGCMADSYAVFDGPRLRGVTGRSALTRAGEKTYLVRTANLAKDFSALSERLFCASLAIDFDAEAGLRFMRVGGCTEMELGNALCDLGAVVLELRHQKCSLSELLCEQGTGLWRWG